MPINVHKYGREEKIMKNIFKNWFKPKPKAPEIPDDLMNQTTISREILEYHTKYPTDSDKLNHILKLKLEELNYQSSGFEATMSRWQLYQAGIPTWTRDLTIKTLWFMLRAEEKIEEKGLSKELMRRAFINDDHVKEHYKIEDDVLDDNRMTDELGNVK